jgi:hypothetical protein
MFHPAFSLVGIRDADRPEATFPLLVNRTEDRALKFCGTGMPPEDSGMPGPRLECGRPRLFSATHSLRIRRRYLSLSGIRKIQTLPADSADEAFAESIRRGARRMSVRSHKGEKAGNRATCRGFH